MSKAYFYFRLTLYSLSLLTVSFIAVLIGIVCTLLGRTIDTNYYVARTFWYTAGPIMGWKFDVEGEEHLWKLSEGAGEGVQGEVGGKKGRSAVMVGNHQSFVDILYLGRIFPKEAAIMAKKSIQYLPGLGWFMLMSGTVFINRSNNRSAVASMQAAGEDMKRKKISLWIFPEGTRHLSASNDLLSFKKGAFYLAVQSGAPIVPVVCENYHRLFDGKTRFRSGTLKIKVLEPIPTTGLTTADVPALMDKTRDLMLQTLRDISARAPSSSSASSRISASASRDEAQRPLLADPSSSHDHNYASTSTNGNSLKNGKKDENSGSSREAAEAVEDELEEEARAESILPDGQGVGVTGNGVNGHGQGGKTAAKRAGRGKLCIA